MCLQQKLHNRNVSPFQGGIKTLQKPLKNCRSCYMDIWSTRKQDTVSLGQYCTEPQMCLPTLSFWTKQTTMNHSHTGDIFFWCPHKDKWYNCDENAVIPERELSLPQ